MSFDMPIASIIRSKILRCAPQTPISEAALRMSQAGCGSILIVDQDVVIGIWTHYDALRVDLAALEGLDAPVSSVMSQPVKTLTSTTSIANASLFFVQHHIRHALVVDASGQPLGVLSQSDVVGLPGIELDVKLKQVGTLINRSAVIVASSLALPEVARTMAMHNRDAVVVDFERDLGIVTERDVLAALSRKDIHVDAGQIATRPLVTVSEETSLFVVRSLCVEKGIRHVGVTDAKGILLGVLSHSEVLASFERDYVDALQQALSEHKQRLAKADQELLLTRQVFEATGEGIMITDQEGVIRTVNPAFSRITGYSREEAIGKTPNLLRSGRHPDVFYADMWRSLKNTGHWEGEIWDRRKNGEVFPKWLSIRTVTDETGEISSHIGTFFDISERKQAEEALRESEERLRTLIDSTPDYISFKNAENRWSEANKSAVELFGLHDYPYQGLTDTELARLAAPELTAALKQSADDDARAWESWPMLRTSQVVVSSGREQTFDVIRVPVFHHDGARKALVTLGRNISDQRQAEQERQEGEQRMHDIMSVLGDGVLVLDGDGKLVYLNPAGEEMLGWRMAELVGKNAHSMIHHKRPDGTLVPVEDCAVHRALDAGDTYRATEDYFIRKDGSLFPISTVATPLLKNGAIIGAVASFHDISGRLEAERAILEREERYRALFNGSSDAISVCVLTAEGPTRIVEVNEVACRQLGYSREEFLNLTANQVDVTDSLGDFPLIVERLLTKGEAVFVTEHRTKSGSKLPVEVSVRAFELKGIRYALCIARDITERQAQEEELRRRAHYDNLTHLPNRAFLLEMTKRTLAKARRDGQHFALLYIDLDGFKEINDTYGHEAGDLVLKTAGERMVKAVRACDIVARLGGDEFVIVLTEMADPQDAEAVARKVEAFVSQPVQDGDIAMDLRTSIGIAVYPLNGEDIPSLMRFADRAMYDCKAAHRRGLTPAGEV